ncbi:MAG: LacI family DNA-binding transcriptional regulator [Eubacteriales bacterium]|nr:LacI family DNA-binding transcriptional regulator [Eubacteriales bacterium]
MSVRMKDIANELFLSEATVSLALNNKRGVNEKTRKLVMETAERMGYMANSNARSLSKKKNKTIGVVVPNIENPYFGHLVRHIDEFVCEKGYKMILSVSNECANKEEEIVRDFVSKRVEGIIVAPVSNLSQNRCYMPLLNKNRIKCVFATSFYESFRSSYVMTDLDEGARMMTSHLIETGHKDIFYLLGNTMNSVVNLARSNGYFRAYEKHSIQCDAHNIVGCDSMDFEGAYKATLNLLKSGKKVDAIMTANDIMALGVLRALKEKEISVPSEISVCGYDNLIFSETASIPITTINQDLKTIAKRAVDIIMAIDEKGKMVIQDKIKPCLVIRSSSAPKNTRGV